MSFDLTFFANSKNVTSKNVENAWRDSLRREIEWTTNSAFADFAEALQKELSMFDSVMIVNKGSAEQGFLSISLQGPNWQDAHNEIGGLLMMHSVVCYDPQSGQTTFELEPI